MDELHGSAEADLVAGHIVGHDTSWAISVAAAFIEAPFGCVRMFLGLASGESCAKQHSDCILKVLQGRGIL